MLTREEIIADDEKIIELDVRRGEIVLRDVYDFLGRFVAYPSDHARVAHAAWVVHTHLMDRWESTPRLAFLSAEPGSGKTRALEITELLVPNAVQAVNVSPAYLFRKVGSEDGFTILFDEIDTVFGPKAKENGEIRGLLNAGHRRGAVAGRCVMHGKTVETEDIPAYSAVALAGLGWLPDTILSRSIIIRMRRRHADEAVEPFRRRHHVAAGHAVRERIELWAATQPSELHFGELPPGIADRNADVWESLVAIADAVGGKWSGMVRAAAVALIAAGAERDPSLGIHLLADLRTVFGDADMLATKVVLRKLAEIEEGPWSDIKGKPLDERGIAHRLKQYGIKSKNLKLDDGAVAKGYTRSDLFDAWARYLPPSPDKSATCATAATSLINQREKVADKVAGSGEPSARVADAVAGVADENTLSATKNPNNISSVAAVAAVAHFPGHDRGPAACAACGKPAGDGNPVGEIAYGSATGRVHRGCRTDWIVSLDAAARSRK
jgi:hypothetical protein